VVNPNPHTKMHTTAALLVALMVARVQASSGQHSFALTTFSPDGRLEQLEHAMEAPRRSPPLVAMCGDDCVVIVSVTPNLGPLVEASATPKVMTVIAGDDYPADDPLAEPSGAFAGHLRDLASTAIPCAVPAGCVVAGYAGLGADARALVARVQAAAGKHWLALGEPMRGLRVAAAAAEAVHEATQQGGGRPFGCSLVVASCDDDLGDNEEEDASSGGDGTSGTVPVRRGARLGRRRTAPVLVQVEASGWSKRVHATALGEGATELQAALAARWRPGMGAGELEALGAELLAAQESTHARGAEALERLGTLEGGVGAGGGDDGAGASSDPVHARVGKPVGTRWRGSGVLGVAVVRAGAPHPAIGSAIVSRVTAH